MPSSEVHQNNDQSSQKKWTSETSLQKRISNNSVALESLRAHAKARFVFSLNSLPIKLWHFHSQLRQFRFFSQWIEGRSFEWDFVDRKIEQVEVVVELWDGTKASFRQVDENCCVSNDFLSFIIFTDILKFSARDLELKRLERERREAEIKAQREWEAHQRVSANKVAQWMRKKQIEASRKVAPPAVTVETPISKPKEFKKGIHYQDWLSKKNVELKALKKEREEMKEQKAQLKFRKTLLQPLRDFGHQVRCREKKPSKPGNKNSICWETIDDWDAAMVQEEATAAAVHQRAWELVDDWDAKAWDTISNWDWIAVLSSKFWGVKITFCRDWGCANKINWLMKWRRLNVGFNGAFQFDAYCCCFW